MPEIVTPNSNTSSDGTYRTVLSDLDMSGGGDRTGWLGI
jgi:hypothetical protein